MCPFQDALYSGSRGAGKTDALIGAWLMHMTHEGKDARGVFFRKTYPELSEVWARMLELYPATGAEANKSEYTFTWPQGPKIELRYLESDDDAARYMGRNWSFAAWDEITQWANPAPIDRLWATLRSAKGLKCIRRLAGNPGGPGTQWVKERYIDDRTAYVPFKWAPNKRLPHLTVESIFIPALLDDNKILLDNDPDYETRLAAIGDDELYKAWRYGDWNILSGRYFTSFKPETSTVKPTALSQWFPRWIAIDHGYAHDAAVTWGCFDGTNVYIYREFSASELTPPELARIIVQMTGRDERIECVYLSPDASNRRNSPRTIEHEIREALPWPVRKADNDRIGGWNLMQSMFKSGTLKVFDDCKKLIKWLSLAQRDPKRPEDVLKADGDDLGDSARYLIKTSEITPRIPDEVLFDQRLKPFVEKENYFGAMVERFKIEDELRRGKQPVQLRGKRRR